MKQRWAVLHWPTAQPVKLMGFVKAESQPEAMLQVHKRWPASTTDHKYFVRPAWRGALMHYSEMVQRHG